MTSVMNIDLLETHYDQNQNSVKFWHPAIMVITSYYYCNITGGTSSHTDIAMSHTHMYAAADSAECSDSSVWSQKLVSYTVRMHYHLLILKQDISKISHEKQDLGDLGHVRGQEENMDVSHLHC